MHAQIDLNELYVARLLPGEPRKRYDTQNSKCGTSIVFWTYKKTPYTAPSLEI